MPIFSTPFYIYFVCDSIYLDSMFINFPFLSNYFLKGIKSMPAINGFKQSGTLQ